MRCGEKDKIEEGGHATAVLMGVRLVPQANANFRRHCVKIHSWF